MGTRVGGGTGIQGDRTLTRAARLLAALAAVVAVLVLVTWFIGPGAVEMLDRGQATMKVNTALACLVIALTIFVRRTPVVALLCLAVVVLAVASLVEFILDLDLGIDELMFQDTITVESRRAGLMAPVTAISLMLLASARWAVQTGARRTVHVLAAAPVGVGALALLGYLFRVEQLFTVVTYSTVAMTTACALLLLSLAVACSVPDGLAWWVVKDRGAGATLVRHILPVAVVVLPLLGILPVVGISRGLFGQRFGIAMLVAATALVLLVVAAVAARRLDWLDRERLGAEGRLRQLNDQLRERRDLEWRRAEELSRNLGEERARYTRAIGKIDDLIWTIEVMPDGTLRPEFSSGDATGLFGGDALDDGADRTREVPKLVHPDDRHLLDAFDEKVRAGKAADTEIRIVGYDDTVRWVWIRGTPRRDRSQLMFDGISTNVTGRRELAERRENLLVLEQEQVRKLKQLNQLREELLAVTGHELRTPLAVVRGYAELLLQDSDLTEVQRKHLEVVANRARQITLLVDDIFDLAKFSAGLASIDVQPVALDEAVTRAVADHRPAAGDADLTFDVDVTPVTVAADPARLRQILDNLLSNAVKYSLPGGRVAVAAHPAKDGNGAAETAVIVVSDGGIGIPEGEIEHVFDRMYRATTAKDRDIKGTGLGLSVTKALVEAHSGTITVVNRPEGGTRFTVAIPVQRPAQAVPPDRVRV